MTVLEEVKSMKAQGMPDDQIVEILKDKGVQYREISDALAQTKIRSAVEQQQPDPYSAGYQEAPAGMEPSIMPPSPEQVPYQQQEYYSQAPAPVPQPQEYPSAEYPYQYAQPAASADLITEIAEQIVAEKLSEVRKHLEKVIDFKTTVDSRIEFLDERLKKIEKTIDVLQSSVLRKVGDYITNVDDIKRELVETQKTFSKLLLPEKKHEHKSPHEHSEHHRKHKQHKK